MIVGRLRHLLFSQRHGALSVTRHSLPLIATISSATSRRLITVSDELRGGALRQPPMLKGSDLWGDPQPEKTQRLLSGCFPGCVTGFGPGFLWLGQSGSQRHAAAVMSSFEKFSLRVVRGTIPRHLGRKQPLESALICRNMKASYLSPTAFMEDAWMKAAVGAGWRLRINNDITWRGVCQHSDTSFRLPLSDYPNSSPPMTGMITGRREEHNCQA